MVHVYQHGDNPTSPDQLHHTNTLLRDGKSPTIKELDSYLEQDSRVRNNSTMSRENTGSRFGTAPQTVVNAHFGNLEGLSLVRHAKLEDKRPSLSLAKKSDVS